MDKYTSTDDISCACNGCSRMIYWHQDLPQVSLAVVIGADDDDIRGIYDTDAKPIHTDDGGDTHCLYVCPYCGVPVAYATDRIVYPFAQAVDVAIGG